MSDEPDYPAIVYHTAKTGLGAGYDKGFAAGVKAAREAVAAEAEIIRSEYAKPTHRLRVKIVERLLAAIDGLTP